MNIFIKRVVVIVSFFTINGICQAAHPAPQQTTISTVADALSYLRRVTSNFPEDAAAEHVYKKAQSGALVKCAKVLYDNAYAQILAALQEIDARIKYWQDQRNHQWRYFLTKSPLKWVTGKSQKEEIENNIGQLQSHQGELYVLLGQLAQLGDVYDHQRKTVFVKDYEKGYAWIDELLDLLPRIKVDIQDSDESSPFITRVMLLRLKLGKVRHFKNDILSEMSDTQIPAHIERNWLKYGALMFGLGYGYKTVGLKELEDSFESLKNNFTYFIVDPVQNIIKDVFRGGFDGVESELLIPQENIDAAREAIKKFVNSLTIQEDRRKNILQDIDLGKSSSFQLLVDELVSENRWNPSTWINYVVGKSLLGQLLGGQAGGRAQKQLADIQRQYVGVGKIAVLTPAILSSWFVYRGYQQFTAKEYSQIRRALVDINSLFVDQTRPLDDERYGKMIYLVHNLKQRAEKEVPLNVRVDFIGDLEMIELQEYDVAAKRRIVEDMFRKYPFLGVAH